jgi:putative transposase
MVGPAVKRAAFAAARDEHGLSERRACRLVGLSRMAARRTPARCVDDPRLRERLLALAAERWRFGYRRLHILLRREGWQVNRKRIERLYREEKLKLRRRTKKRVPQEGRGGAWCPVAANQRWSLDFTEDALASGRKFRTANLKDDCTRECPAIEVDLSLPAERVVEMLERAGDARGFPEILVVDNGPELRGRVLEAWAWRRGVQLYFIDPGKPVQNAYIESFNGRFRDECLNLHWFVDLDEARAIIEAWRIDYNETRPHSSLGYRTPAEFAASRAASATGVGSALVGGFAPTPVAAPVP